MRFGLDVVTEYADLNPSGETPERVVRRGAGPVLHLAVAVVLGAMGAGAQSLPGPQPSPVAQTGATAAKSSTPAAATITSSPDAQAAAKTQATNEARSLGAAKAGLAAWKGLRVEKVEFEGVVFDAKDPLPQQIPQRVGDPLDPAKVAASIRQLFASGRYRDIRVEGTREGDGVTLVFAGTPQLFVGRVTVRWSEGRAADVFAGVCDQAAAGDGFYRCERLRQVQTG